MPLTTITWQDLTRATVVSGTLTNDNTGSNNCFTNASGTGDSGGRSVESIASAQDWEFRCTLGPNPSGRTFVGLAGAFSLDFTTWPYCIHISTENNTVSPHPPNSLFIYENGFPNRTYRNAIWQNNEQILRIINRSGVVRYYLDCLWIYTSALAPTYPLYAVASMACHNSQVKNAAFVTGPGAGQSIGGTIYIQGAETASVCAQPWTIPTPTALPQPPTAGAPIATRIQEVAPIWGEFGQTFSDGSSDHNTIQTTRIRRFEIDWEGLTKAEALVLDTHYNATANGLAFSITIPHTISLGSVIANATTDKIEKAAHGLDNGQPIVFAATSTPTGLTMGTTYYVINKTANDFEIALSAGGSKVTWTADGTGVTCRTLPETITGCRYINYINRGQSKEWVQTRSAVIGKFVN